MPVCHVRDITKDDDVASRFRDLRIVSIKGSFCEAECKADQGRNSDNYIHQCTRIKVSISKGYQRLATIVSAECVGYGFRFDCLATEINSTRCAV